MGKSLPPGTRRRLDIQGFEAVGDDRLAEVVPWQRMAYLLCATLAGIGTALAAPTVLLVLFPIAAAAAASPVHPFDLIYNFGIRHLRKTGPLPRRGAPARFACGMGSAWLLATAWAFSAGYAVAGYALGVSLTAVAALVGSTDICIPSTIYRSLFGWPARREEVTGGAAGTVTGGVSR